MDEICIKATTEEKGKMLTETLSNLVVHKFRMLALGISPVDFEPSEELLARCKAATHLKNTSHSD